MRVGALNQLPVTLDAHSFFLGNTVSFSAVPLMADG